MRQKGLHFSCAVLKNGRCIDDLKDDVLTYNHLERLFVNHNGGWYFCFYVEAMLANMLVRFALGTNMLAKEKMKEKSWPTFLKKIKNVGQQICKTGLE